MRNIAVWAVFGAMVSGCTQSTSTTGHAPRANDAPARIAVVSEWGEFVEQKPIAIPCRSKDGDPPVSVRLGIEGRACDANGGLLLYVLAENFVPKQPRGREHPPRVRHARNTYWAGPLLAAVFEAGSPAAACEPFPDRHLAGEAGQRERRNLYLAPVRAGKAGKYAVRLYEHTGRIVAAADFEVTAATHGWMAFSGRAAPASAPGRSVLDPPDLSVQHLAFRAGAVVPDWSSYGEVPCGPMPCGPPAKLPTFVPADPDVGLTLTAADGLLSIKSVEPILTCRSDWHFISRWWINGRPVRPSEPKWHGDANGLVTMGRHIRIQLDTAALGLRGGDKVEVQVMYLAAGWQYVGDGDMLHALPGEHAHIPIVSNKAGFVVKPSP